LLHPVRIRTLIDWLVWPAVIWVVVFWRLGYLSLLDPDEAHYAALTREMIATRQWLVPILDGAPLIDKPVLYHWLQAAAVSLFGENEFALRLPSACAAIMLFWTVWWAGRTLAGAPLGRTAALMAATAPLSFALASVGVFDMVYTAFLFGAVAALIVSSITEQVRLQVVGWVALAFAVMVKGPVAMVLVVLFGLVLWANPATRPLARRLRWARGFLIVAVLAAPWFVYMATAYREQFVRDYLLAGNLWYFTRPEVFSHRRSNAWFYVRTYLGAGFPWSLLAAGTGIDALWSRRQLPAAAQALWLWVLVVIGFFSIAGFKLDTYIFPAIPATCLIGAMASSRTSGSVQLPATAFAGWLTAVALTGGGILLAATMFQIGLDLSPWAAIVPAALFVGGLCVVMRLRSAGPLATTGALVATLLAVYSGVVLQGFPVLERSRPTASVGRWVHRHAPPDTPVGVYGLSDWHASLRFYSHRPLVILHDQPEVTAFLTRQSGTYVLMSRSDAEAFRAQGVSIRCLGGRRAIVGRSGKFIRKQVWGRIVVTTAQDPLMLAANEMDADLLDE
jgi:4-amino-4-deoxy-L-arabinose transferase-like glycosyltransferase